MNHDSSVDRLLRQVQARVIFKEELRLTARGLAATAVILAFVLALLGAVVAGAMLFAGLLEALAH